MNSIKIITVFGLLALLASMGQARNLDLCMNEMSEAGPTTTQKKPTSITTKPPTTLMDPTKLLQRIITQSDQLILETKTALEQYRIEKNYFTTALEKELVLLMKYTEHLKKESSDIDSQNPFFREFVYNAEIQVGKTMGRIHEIMYLGQKGTDPGYVQILHLMDALKTRAYADIGYLFMHGKAEQAQSIKDEILQIEELERQLKSTDFKLTPQTSEQLIEKMLEHERHLEEELYKIEEDNL
ncbi:uncharacterized protein LOC113792410 [Dermatophagoides pteronyssinus]|uniref:uncharacterized protein LOC113792410 n=1 Tax=Dermatophagoides pteronyssinus TaxID=6956 RepID=UPI003F66DD57